MVLLKVVVKHVIFQSYFSVFEVLGLAATCRWLHFILSSQRLQILFQAAKAQFGLLADAISLVTYNASQAAYVPRPCPSLSIALLFHVFVVGRVANAWTTIYPIAKWRGPDSPSRRLLRSTEQHRLHRALYRIWLYTAAFHNSQYIRTTRNARRVINAHLAFLWLWPTHHLAEMLDLHSVFSRIVENKICPSNGTVLRRHRACFPDDFFPAPRLAQLDQHRTVQMARVKQRKPEAAEGWDDEITHHYIVEDMLKLDPATALFLWERVRNRHSDLPRCDCCNSVRAGSTYRGERGRWGGVLLRWKKSPVERFVGGLGEWF